MVEGTKPETTTLTQLKATQKTITNKLDQLLINQNADQNLTPNPYSSRGSFSTTPYLSTSSNNGTSGVRIGSTYAQMAKSASTNQQKNEKGFTTIQYRRHQSNNQSSPKPPITSYRDKRIVLLGSAETPVENAKIIRDRINSEFKERLNNPAPIIASIMKSHQGKNVVLIINNGHHIEEMLINDDIIRPHLNYEKMVQDVQWSKIIVNGLRIEDWNNELSGLDELQTELQEFSGLRLATRPRWITPKAARATKMHGSVVLSFDDPIMHQKALKTLHFIGSCKVFTRPYKEARITDQCGNCWRHGHPKYLCKSETRCEFCKENHQSGHHSCPICQKGKECEHNQCVNCEDNHEASNKRCPEWTKAYQKQEAFNTKRREFSQLHKDPDANILNKPTNIE